VGRRWHAVQRLHADLWSRAVWCCAAGCHHGPSCHGHKVRDPAWRTVLWWKQPQRWRAGLSAARLSSATSHSSTGGAACTQAILQLPLGSRHCAPRSVPTTAPVMRRFLVMHVCSMSRRFYALRRSAVSCVVAICSFSRRNQINLIGKHEDAYNTLMRQILPACGDVHTQVCWAGRDAHWQGCATSYEPMLPTFCMPGSAATHLPACVCCSSCYRQSSVACEGHLGDALRGGYELATDSAAHCLLFHD
jgi:hypothetical protein